MSTFYVFYVNRGYLVALDYEISLQSVRHLQVQIHEATGISIHDQVLLAGNGCTMETNKRVNSYIDAGSISKPVFLFARSSRSEKDELTVSQQRDEVLREIYSTLEQGQECMHLRDNKSQQYTKLAEHAKSCLKVAETTVQATARIVQEHHNLNGGWMALVYNLNETLLRLEKKQKKYETHVAKMEQLKVKAEGLFDGFDASVEQLKSIKLPPSLQARPDKEMTLYEWISSTDPNHSLLDLVNQVKEQITVLHGFEEKDIEQSLRFVRDLMNKTDNREIKGINKRISQIEHTLEVLNDHRKTIHLQTQSIQQHNPRLMDEGVLTDALTARLSSVSTIHDLLKTMTESCVLFFKSKGEVLDNVRKRLYGWVVTAYEKLHQAHMNIVVFEEKLHGLKQRLDLVRQVKETPLMFATCVTEIMRRTQLHKEFRAWHSSHTERCLTFSSEENQLRSVFAAKLEKHFLRVIFQGMFDKLPMFFVKHVPDFDQQLPNIETEYYRNLRKSVDSLESVLRVNSPQVYQRLAGRPTSLGHVQSTGQLNMMRRDESFISYDPASNLTTNLHNAFPSNAWLADEGMDMSPSTEPALLMAQSPSMEKERHPFHSGQRLPSLHDINETMQERDDSELELPHSHISHSVKSAPIQIPIRRDARMGDDDDEASHFSTPEDQFRRSKDDKEEQFPVDDISTRSQMMEVLRPMTVELISLKQDLTDTRSDILLYKDRFDLDVQSVIATATRRLLEVLTCKDSEHNLECKRMQEKIEAALAQQRFCEGALADAQQEMQGKESEIGSLRESIEESNKKLSSLQDEMMAMEERFNEERSEIFKKLTIEFELEKDREASEFRETIEEKEEQIRQLQRDLEKKQQETEKLKKGPGSEEFRKVIELDTRATLEREFKTRIELLSKGFEQKKEEAVVRMRKDIEYESRKKEAEKEFSVRLLALERDLMREAFENPDASCKTVAEIAERVQKESERLMQESHVSSYMYSSSPRPSPRKPFGSDSLHISTTSLSSPIPSSLPEDPIPIKSDPSSDISLELTGKSTPEEIVLPKIIPPPEHTPPPPPIEEVKQVVADSEMRDESGSESSDTVRKESDDSSKRDSDGSEKRAEKRRSTERVENEGKKTLLMEESFIPGHGGTMTESVMPQARSSSMSSEMLVDESMAVSTFQESGGLISNSCQTRLSMRTMDYMVSLNDIREGTTVLVVWDDRHNAYILFCISNFIHFVKETSVRRLGLSNTEDNASRKNWVLGKVAHVDLCIIKKPTNRYKLPVETQVYRVDVLPVTFDATAKATTIPSSRDT